MNMAGRRVFSCRGFCQGWRRNCRNAPIRSAGRNVSVWCEQQPKATAVRAFAHGVTHHEAQSPLWLTGRCSARTALASTYIRRQAEFDAWARSCQIGLLLPRMEPVSVIKRAPVVILAAIAAAGCGGGGHKEFEIAGSWRGNLAQKGMHPFVVTATIRAPSPSARNTVHYSGIDCGGRWTYLGREDSAYRFRGGHHPRQERDVQGRRDG